jgi:hypothetical protein
MTEQSPSKSSQGAVAAILDALHPDAKGFISAMIVFLAFGATVYGFVQLPTFIKNLSSSASKEQCWELRELQGGTWKFNKCAGEAFLAFVLWCARWVTWPPLKIKGVSFVLIFRTKEATS